MTSRRIRIGLISTLKRNVGDDLIRKGIVFSLRNLTKSQLDFCVIDKHEPTTVYRGAHALKMLRRTPFVGRRLAHKAAGVLSSSGKSWFDDCAVIVQCGAPVLWPGCHKSEWAQPLWYGVIRDLHEKIAVLNLAAGSAYPWTDQPATLRGTASEQFVRDTADYSALTTARDALASSLYDSVGRKAPLFPCTALLSSEGAVGSLDDGPLLFNYMPGGGHFSFGQPVESGNWLREARALVRSLRSRHEVVLLCHSDSEAVQAAALDSSLPIIKPNSYREYHQLVKAAKGGVFNRLHAAVALAGLGIPSVAIGTDSRMLMVSELGLPVFYVNEATSQAVESAIEDLLSNRKSERDRLTALTEQTRTAYDEVLGTTLSSIL